MKFYGGRLSRDVIQRTGTNPYTLDLVRLTWSWSAPKWAILKILRAKARMWFMKCVGFSTCFLFGCGVDGFYSIAPLEQDPPDAGTQETSDVADALSEHEADAMVEGSPDSGTEGSALDAKSLCPVNDVEFGGRCFYLDGSNGACDPGYVLSTNAALAAALGANPNAWQGKNYRHAVSDNACVRTKDGVENFGMVSHANVPGPFGAGEPVQSGSSCWMVYFTNPKQLTLCESTTDGGQ